MLRSTRPLLSNSSRAVVSQKATISSLRRPSFQFSDPTRLGRRVAPAPTRLNPLAPRTWIASSSKPPPRIQSERDPEEEKRFGQQKLASDPQAVSTQSSVRHLFEPDDPKTEAEKPVSSSLQDELVCAVLYGPGSIAPSKSDFFFFSVSLLTNRSSPFSRTS